MDKKNSINCSSRVKERFSKTKYNNKGKFNIKNSFINPEIEERKYINKRLETIKSLLFDDSLAINFSFVSSSLYNINLGRINLSEKRNNIIYSYVFNQDDYDIKNSSIFSIVESNNSIVKDNDIKKDDLTELSSNNIKFNFGDEDPHIVYRNLIMKLNRGFMSNSLKEEISNYLNNLYHFPIFRFNMEYNNQNSHNGQFPENNENYINSIIYRNMYSNIQYRKTNINYPVRYKNITSIIVFNDKLMPKKKQRNIIKSQISDKNKISRDKDIIKAKIKDKKHKSKPDKNKSKPIIRVKENKFIINLEETDSEI